VWKGRLTGAAAALPDVAGQERGEALYCIVDVHAITVPYEPVGLRESMYDLTALLLAAGLDPARSTLFRQGDVQEHTELCWLCAASPSSADCSGCRARRRSTTRWPR
jgi:tryptophanyl-tRNA synthetase